MPLKAQNVSNNITLKIVFNELEGTAMLQEF